MWPPEPMSEPELDCTTETSGNLSTGDRENNQDPGGLWDDGGGGEGGREI